MFSIDSGAAMEFIASCPMQELEALIEAKSKLNTRRRYKPALAARVLRSRVRSLVIGTLGSLRLAKMVDLVLFLDTLSPDGVAAGLVNKAKVPKDGSPMRLMVPAEGVLGGLTWLREHVKECGAGDEEQLVAFRAWTGGHGSIGDVLKAEGLAPGVVKKEHLVDAIYRLWSMLPCGLSSEERERYGYTTHAHHRMWSDLARMLGENTTLAFAVSDEVAKGFSMDDVEA